MRKCSVYLGNTDWTTSSGVDAQSSEWIVLSNEGLDHDLWCQHD